jgi:DNA-binding beta-propeller fold protein YncE
MQRLSAIFILAMLALGCGSRRNIPIGSGGGTGGHLYGATSSSILRVSNALAVSGNVAPTATLTVTGLSTPQRLLVDTAANRLFVANQGGGSILIFDNASTLTGTVAPNRTISGAATTLVAPFDLALDTANNLLYVADGASILVFAGASSITGNTPPVRSINMGFAVTGILLNTTSNQMFVANSAGEAVSRLDGAGSQNGAAVIAATISGSNTALAHPKGLALDGAGRLAVSNSAVPTSLTFYANATAATGNVVPVANITGAATLLQSPGQIFLNTSVTTGELYVVDSLAGSILIFSNVSTATGNVAPARNINGTSTGPVANAVNGLALDTTR